MSGKCLSPFHSQKGCFGWEGTHCTAQPRWEPSPKIWLGEKVTRADPTQLLIAGGAGSHGPSSLAATRWVPTEPHTTHGGPQGIHDPEQCELSETATIWLSFLLWSSKPSKERGKKG